MWTCLILTEIPLTYTNTSWLYYNILFISCTLFSFSYSKISQISRVLRWIRITKVDMLWICESTKISRIHWLMHIPTCYVINEMSSLTDARTHLLHHNLNDNMHVIFLQFYEQTPVIKEYVFLKFNIPITLVFDNSRYLTKFLWTDFLYRTVYLILNLTFQ